jgi:glutamate 5-kinase
VVPVINENDTVAVDEIMLGDNDNLSAMVASLLEAQLLIMLSDVEGLYQQDPRHDPSARLIPIVEEVGSDVQRLASGPPGQRGVGGMFTKIQAAGMASKAGIATVIAHGRTRDVITRVLAGEELGTLFLPQRGRLAKRKHWIAFVLRPKGGLKIDQGAHEALLKRGKSLLASGIIEVCGRFDRGDAVDILSSRETPIARGLSNYSSSDLERIKGLKSSAIEDKLGYRYLDEIVHRDNLVIL